MSFVNSNGDFELSSLRGGLDDTSPHMALAPDACVEAENIEFVRSTLGERRKGCEAIDLPTELEDTDLDAVTWMYRHLPTSDAGEAELWILAQSLDDNTSVMARRKAAGWEIISPDDAFDVTDNQGHRLSAQTLHSKLFFGGKSSENRLHVFDGTSLRRCGLAEPGVLSAADTGAGTLDTLRYYRVRYIREDADGNILRSEPSESISFTPSGAGASVRLTKPATIDEGETHWEVEASLDDADYYRIATVEVATTTYDDSTAAGTGYATAENELSADIGDYTLIPSGKFLTVDEDRLLIAGAWDNPDEASRVMWTPVYSDPGDGNDERLELGVDPFLDLDGYEGGEITGMSRAVSGYIFVFKRGHIYKLVRTNSRAKAYEAVALTKARGALPGSLVEAVNQVGQPSLFFLDPSVGPTRLSASGLQWCGRDIQTLWARVNIDAAVPCHGVYYNKSRQLHYWLAVDGADYPNFKIVLHVNEMRDTEEGARRGWVTVGLNNRIATAHCSVMFSDNVDSTDPRSFALVPFIGKEAWDVDSTTIRDYIQMCDVGGTDAHTDGDTESAYRAVVTSKPFALTGLLTQHGIMGGALIVKASSTPDGLVFVKAVRDFGKESKTVNATFYSPTAETRVIAKLDDLNFSEMYTMQISLGDLDDNVTPPDQWDIDLLQLRVVRGMRS